MQLASACSLGLLFDPEDVGSTFLRIAIVLLFFVKMNKIQGLSCVRQEDFNPLSC
jgi:hypothetical protein